MELTPRRGSTCPIGIFEESLLGRPSLQFALHLVRRPAWCVVICEAACGVVDSEAACGVVDSEAAYCVRGVGQP